MSLSRSVGRARGRARRRAAGGNSLVGFSVADATYAIDIANVLEILRPGSIVSLAHAPPAVLGVTNHRGKVLPVMDVRRRFGLPPATLKSTKWIVVRTLSRELVLVVDGVSDVFSEGPDPQKLEVGSGDAARGIDRVITDNGRMVFVLDVERIAASTHVIAVEQPARLA